MCEEISVISLIVFEKRHTIHIGALLCEGQPWYFVRYSSTICKSRVYLREISLESPRPFQAKKKVIKHSLSICEEISVISLIVFEKRHTIHIGALLCEGQSCYCVT